MSERVILAYSGGLDTSVAISWIGKETGHDLAIAYCNRGLALTEKRQTLRWTRPADRMTVLGDSARLVQALAAVLCTTVQAKELSPIPTKLVASIDEWKGRSYRVELAADGSINYFDALSRGRPARIRVPPERWRSFRSHLDAAKVWSWRREYMDYGVADGTSWDFAVVYCDRKISSKGLNAYPPQKQFQALCTALRELTGGKPFE
jgi:hypothetical protein